MTRVSVVGTCQVHGIADSLIFLLPGVKVLAFEYTAIKDKDAINQIQKCVVESDYVFSHFLPESAGPLGTTALRQAVPKFWIIPSVSFTGFHPDCIYISHNDKALESAIGPLHSGIIAAAYSIGVPVDRVSSLFNAFIFRKLGYYEEFAKARLFLQEHMERQGFDLTTVWESWLKQGAFMHTIVHPTIWVLASIAKFLAERAGLAAPGATAPSVPMDWLANHAVWPVYPELARPLNVPGSYVFKRGGGPDWVRGDRPYLGLETMIANSYARYQNYPPEAFQSEPIKRIMTVLSETIR